MVAGFFEVEDTFGLSQNVVGSLVKFIAGVLVFDLKDVRHIFDQLPDVLNFELAANLLGCVLRLGAEALVYQFDHLVKAVVEISLELLKRLVFAALECVAHLRLHRHGSQSESAFADTFVVSGTQGQKFRRWGY